MLCVFAVLCCVVPHTVSYGLVLASQCLFCVRMAQNGKNVKSYYTYSSCANTWRISNESLAISSIALRYYLSQHYLYTVYLRILSIPPFKHLCDLEISLHLSQTGRQTHTSYSIRSFSFMNNAHPLFFFFSLPIQTKLNQRTRAIFL